MIPLSPDIHIHASSAMFQDGESNCWSDVFESEGERVEGEEDKPYWTRKVFVPERRKGLNNPGWVTAYFCKQCPSHFAKIQSAIHHISFHGSNNKYKCSICNYAVSTGTNAAR